MSESGDVGSGQVYGRGESGRLFATYDKGLTAYLEGSLKRVEDGNANFDGNAVSVLAKRYLTKDENGVPQETPEGLVARTAANVAFATYHHTGDVGETLKVAQDFYDLMISQDFMPNSPTLMNAGRKMQQLAACFVLPIEDDMKSIFGRVADTAFVHQTGGGTGFSFGNLRRKNDFVSSTYGKASGPVSFIQAYDGVTDSVNQGGFRRGANMGMMPIDHPDVLQFIHAKGNESSGRYKNFNFSVAVTDEFMDAVKEERHYVLRNPKGGEVSDLTLADLERDQKSVEMGLITENDRILVNDSEGNIYYQNAEEIDLRGNITRVSRKKVGKVAEDGRVMLHAPTVFDEIADLAWRNGEPGVVFIDRINEYNPTHPKYYSGEGELPRGVGVIEATNPCGEQPLLGYEACNLGSINLGHFVVNGKIDFDRLEGVVDTATLFLDQVIDMSAAPLEEIVQTVQANRKIGLGIMGLADMLARMDIPYDSDEGRAVAGEVMAFIDGRSKKRSQQLAEERGAFPNFEHSRYAEGPKMRNATNTTIAPTGSVSMIAMASSSGEPNYSLVYTHTDADGQTRHFVNSVLVDKLEEEGIDSERVLGDLRGDKENKISPKSLQELNYVPEKIKEVFVTAYDISVEDHVRMQAAIQKHVDNAVSKTINMPHEATRDDVKKAYRLAFETGCKGITVYRKDSRVHQVLDSGKGFKGKGGVAELPRGVAKKVPDHLPAAYTRQPTPWGHLHLNVSLDPKEDYKPTQFFAQLGKAGDVVNADLEAIGRLASTIMRLGGDLEKHVIGQLEGIGSHKRIPTVDGGVVSLPDGLGKALKNHQDLIDRVGVENVLLGNYDLEEIRQQKIAEKQEKVNNGNGLGNNINGNGNGADEVEGLKCPDCGGEVAEQGGCWSCLDVGCAWSKC